MATTSNNNTAPPKASGSSSGSKKRRLSASATAEAAAPPVDARFAALEGLSHDDDDEQGEEEEEGTALSFHTQPVPSTHTLPAHLLPSALSGNKSTTPGLIYLSRIPPGMGPSKVKHLLGAYGEVGRVFLARAGEFFRPGLRLFQPGGRLREV